LRGRAARPARSRIPASAQLSSSPALSFMTPLSPASLGRFGSPFPPHMLREKPPSCLRRLAAVVSCCCCCCHVGCCENLPPPPPRPRRGRASTWRKSCKAATAASMGALRRHSRASRSERPLLSSLSLQRVRREGGSHPFSVRYLQKGSIQRVVSERLSVKVSRCT